MKPGRPTRRGVLRWLWQSSLSAVALGTVPATAFAQARPLYRDPSAPIPLRVRDLLARMTLEEKVAQLCTIWGGKQTMLDGERFDAARAGTAFPHSIGHITRPSDRRGVGGAAAAAGGTAARWRTPASTVAFINGVQRWATTRTRLGIPVLFHEESLHGYMATDATMFPQAIALAGSFDPDLMRRVHGVIAREARVRGVPLVLSPVVDIVRDPRWGRIEETFGECPHLVSRMGVAAVMGLQGGGPSERLRDGHVFATLKHMTGHGQPESGNNVAPAPLAERELREVFFPPFRDAICEAGAAAVMPSYNEIDGIPSHANSWLLRTVLRGEWGFDGLIVSDYGALLDMVRLHHVADDAAHAGRLALVAGVDSDLPDGDSYASLTTQVRNGVLDEALVDQSVARMLTLKFRAGLFENPYGDARATQQLTGNASARALALEAARKSLCLLKNDGTLPLDRARLRRLAVIGPNAAIARLGGYSSVPRQSVTLLDGIRAVAGGGIDIVHAQGVHITRSEDRSADSVELADPVRNQALIIDAVAAARDCDAIILAIGDTEQTSREGFAANHLGDRTDVDITGEQNDLVHAMAALGKPLVVCAINGRPPSWPLVVGRANALLECWYPGQEGGTAIAEALFGDINPGAKLPVSIVRHAGQIPLFYNRKPSSRRGYLFDDAAPLFPFGHGLSYTRFAIAPPAVDASQIRAGEGVSVNVDIANIGDRAGDEVVQIYIRRRNGSVTSPVLELKAFRRVTLQPGERRTLRFDLPGETFALWNRDMREMVEPGVIDLLVGPSSAQLQSTRITIV